MLNSTREELESRALEVVSAEHYYELVDTLYETTDSDLKCIINETENHS